MKPTINLLAGALVAVAAASAFPGITYAQSYRGDSMPAYEHTNYAALGVVESIDTIQGANQGNRIAGTILGGVLGGVLGHQIGSGRGNDAATVVGALGGAALGHEIGEGKGTADAYRLRVRMDNGESRAIEQTSLNGVRTGDRVRVDGDHLTLYAGGERNDWQGSAPTETRQNEERSKYRPDDRANRYDRDGNRVDDPASRNDNRARPEALYRNEGNVRYDADGYRIDDRGYRY